MLRNAVRLAKQCRDDFFDSANARSLSRAWRCTLKNEFVDCENHLSPQDPTQVTDTQEVASDAYPYEDEDYDDHAQGLHASATAVFAKASPLRIYVLQRH